MTRIIAIILGTILVLGAAACSSTTAQDREVADAGISVPTQQDAIDGALPLTLQAQTELEATVDAADRFDVDGMILHVNNAGDLMDEAAVYWLGIDDAIYGYMASAADHFHASASALAAGDFDGATGEMTAATGDIEAATAAL
jgi:hypothetical protein